MAEREKDEQIFAAMRMLELEDPDDAPEIDLDEYMSIHARWDLHLDYEPGCE